MAVSRVVSWVVRLGMAIILIFTFPPNSSGQAQETCSPPVPDEQITYFGPDARIQDTLTNAGDLHWYKFEATLPSSSAQVTLSGPSDYDLYVLFACSTQFDDAQTSNVSVKTSKSLDVPQGMNYVLVLTQDAPLQPDVPYTLSVTITQKDVAAAPTPTPTTTELATATSTPVPTATPTPSTPTVASIDSPKDGDRVSANVTVNGHLSGSLGSQYVTVVVRPKPDDPKQSWWVQGPVVMLSDTSWQLGSAIVGQAGDSGVPFRMCAVLTTQAYQPGPIPTQPSGPTSCVNLTRQ